MLKRIILSAFAACLFTTALTPQALSAEPDAAPNMGPIISISQVVFPALNEPLTTREYVNMVCRIFAPGEDIESPVDYCRREGWLEVVPDSHGMDKPIVRGCFYSYVLKAADVYLYGPTLYGLPMMSPMNHAMVRMKELGLCPQASNSMDTISRGEALRFMLMLRQKKLEVPLPEMLKDVKFRIEDPEAYTYILSALPDVPAPILDEFNRRGWTLVLGRSYLDQFTEELGFQAGGMTTYTSKRIDVQAAKSVVHEFGHFLDGVLDYTDQHKDVILSEMGPSGPILGEYSQTNEREFFAEFFDFWLKNKDNPSRMSKLQAAAPETYAAFEAMEASGWIPVPEAAA